jgi:hypothetical protein
MDVYMFINITNIFCHVLTCQNQCSDEHKGAFQSIPLSPSPNYTNEKDMFYLLKKIVDF